MSTEQLTLIALIGALMLVFALDRWRIEVVSAGGLAVAVLIGLVRPERAFAGFSDPAVITVVEILILAQLIGRSRVVDLAARRISVWRMGPAATVGLLCAAGAALSAVMNNIGALALMLPVAYSVCAARGLDLRQALMPISFATLLGGLCSLIGTPANLVVNSARIEATGSGFALFGFAPVGLPLVGLGLIWLAAVGWRLLPPSSHHGSPGRHYPTDMFLTEARVPAGSDLSGLSVADIEARDGIAIHGVFRGAGRLFARKSAQVIAEGDELLLSGRVGAIRGFLRRSNLQPALSEPPAALPAERVWTEIVVMPQSTIIGSRISAVHAFAERNVQVVGISPQGPRIEGRLGDIAPGVGDILLLRGTAADIDAALEETQCVPVAAGPAVFVDPDTILPLVVFAGAIGLASSGLMVPEIAFGLALVVLLLSGVLDLRQALRDTNWPVIVMLAAMLPIGEAVYATGTAELLARGFLDRIGDQSAVVLLTAVLLSATLITPFLNNVTTAVILAPIAVSVARQSGLSVDPFLIAVAVGASTDFLTPFGHHNNTLVMGLGGYAFKDYPKVGAPLTLIVLAAAPPLLALLA